MIQFLLLVSRQGKIRLSKWYTFLPRAQQIKIAQVRKRIGNAEQNSSTTMANKHQPACMIDRPSV